MKNFDQSSNANLVQINHLLEKVEDMNKIHIQINDGIKNISALLSNIDSINADLNDCEYLFKLLDKEDIFRRHFEGEVQSGLNVSLMVFNTIVEDILDGIANVFEGMLKVL